VIVVAHEGLEALLEAFAETFAFPLAADVINEVRSGVALGDPRRGAERAVNARRAGGLLRLRLWDADHAREVRRRLVRLRET
jgi:hypothetical protein